MTSAAKTSNVSPSRFTLWHVVGLAALTQAVNQIDKAVVGLAAEPIMQELSLSTTEYGWVAGSLYTFFALGGIAVGWFVAPRLSPRRILMLLLLLWSVSQLPIVFAASLTVLVACRIILGAAEGSGAATCMNAVHEWFPEQRRELPGALVFMGGTVGSMLAAPALTYLITVYGWRSAFLACSVLGLLILGGWSLIRNDGPYAVEKNPDRSSRPVNTSPLLPLLLDRTILGNAIAGLSAYWIVGFMVAWLAPYVRDQGGLEVMQSGWALSAIYLGQTLIVVAVAALSQRLMSLGYASRIARAYVMAGCLLTSSIAFLGMAYFTDPTARLILITLATTLPGSIFTISAAMISDIAPEHERHRLVTLLFAIATVSALVSPGIAGAGIELGETHGWRPALLVLMGVGLLGGILSLVLLRPELTKARFNPAGP